MDIQESNPVQQVGYVPLEAHIYPWISMDIHGYPWISMDIQHIHTHPHELSSQTVFMVLSEPQQTSKVS
jgi:hypothetical protein